MVLEIQSLKRRSVIPSSLMMTTTGSLPMQILGQERPQLSPWKELPAAFPLLSLEIDGVQALQLGTLQPVWVSHLN